MKKKKKIIFFQDLKNCYIINMLIPQLYPWCIYIKLTDLHILRNWELYFFIFLSERLVLISKCEYKSTILLLMFYFVFFRCMSLHLSGVALARYDIRLIISFAQCQMFIAAFCKIHVFFWHFDLFELGHEKLWKNYGKIFLKKIYLFGFVVPEQIFGINRYSCRFVVKSHILGTYKTTFL